MDNNHATPDSIFQKVQDTPVADAPAAEQQTPQEPVSNAPAAEISAEFSSAEPAAPEAAQAAPPEAPAVSEADPAAQPAPDQAPPPEAQENAEVPDAAKSEEAADTAAGQEADFAVPSPSAAPPRSRLRELKRKLVSGPERRYYQLEGRGLGKLQLAILINVLLVALCVGITTMFTMNMFPANRLQMVIFSQVLAMMLSGLFSCNMMLDSLEALFKGRFTVNTLLTITFAACFVDGFFCLKELRVPCCAAFCVESTMALWSRYHRHTTEMAQMDTMRKAVRLHGLVKVSGYYKNMPGLLRRDAEVEDFMEHYNRMAGPELLQSVYAGLSLLVCMTIAGYAGLVHGVSMGVQIFATSLLVAVPASFFLSITRPMALLENRLHMVGSVLCGWKGVKGLCGKAAFPLTDQDLFPQGSTKLNGLKFYGDRDPDEVVAYTTALITKAGGGLVPVFQQLLTSRNAAVYEAEKYQNYGTGGIGGEVNGESVLLGSQQFLQDMGVEIPEGTMVNQAVYAAIDGQLCAVYAMTYAKMRSAAAGLVALCGYRKITPIMLCGDFTLSESFLRGKFNIKTHRMVFPDRNERQQLSEIQPDPNSRILAISTREELVSSAYLITGARSLRLATNLAVGIHLVGGILGLLIMAVLAFLGNTALLTPTNILLYQLIWAIPGLLVTEWTRIA